MKTGLVKKDDKSYAYIEFENGEEIDKFFDEVERKLISPISLLMRPNLPNERYTVFF